VDILSRLAKKEMVFSTDVALVFVVPIFSWVHVRFAPGGQDFYIPTVVNLSTYIKQNVNLPTFSRKCYTSLNLWMLIYQNVTIIMVSFAIEKKDFNRVILISSLIVRTVIHQWTISQFMMYLHLFLTNIGIGFLWWGQHIYTLHLTQFLVFTIKTSIGLFVGENCSFPWQISAMSLCIMLLVITHYLHVYIDIYVSPDFSKL
jgi:hypothetical protein